MKIDYTLPYPPSVNRYWRCHKGRAIISAAGRAYRYEVAIQARAVQPLEGSLAVQIFVYPPDKRRRDLDNVLKAIFDSLQHAGAYYDDNQIDRIEVTRCEQIKGGCVYVAIKNLTVRQEN